MSHPHPAPRRHHKGSRSLKHKMTQKIVLIYFLVLTKILFTFKAFEELLRANDIDYYMGQSFREQLAQSTALAQRVFTKISGRKKNLNSPIFFLPLLCLLIVQVNDWAPLLLFSCHYAGDRAESHDDKNGHELLAMR